MTSAELSRDGHGNGIGERINIVCNAEPFAGGPAATLRAILPHLRKRLMIWGPVTLHHVGSSLAMELQELQDKRIGSDGANWDEFHHVDLYTNRERGKTELASVLQLLRPRLVVTAMDRTFAAVASEAGCRVIIVDLLLWFWPEIPAIWRQADLVIAADFYGVTERIKREKLVNVVTVPPLGPAPIRNEPTRLSRRNVLLNFGGMLNPRAPNSDYVEHACLVHDLARRALEMRNAALPGHEAAELTVLVASLEVSRKVNALHPGTARTVLPHQALELMSTAQLVCCTPGLGNLFAAGAVAETVMLLPPLHEGHALQSHLVQQAGIAVDAVEWHELVGGEPIQYVNRQTIDVMEDTRKAQKRVIHSPQAQEIMINRFFQAMMRGAAAARGETSEEPPLRKLIATFGQDDDDRIAAEIVNALQRQSSTL